RHMTGDFSMDAEAYLAEQITPAGRDGEVHGPVPWVAVQPRPWPELSIQIRGDKTGRAPPRAAASGFAPEVGWAQQEFVRNGNGVRHVMTWGTHIGAIPWEWRVLPGRGEMERISLDVPRLTATIKQTEEIVRAWIDKLAVKALKVNLDALHQP